MTNLYTMSIAVSLRSEAPGVRATVQAVGAPSGRASMHSPLDEHDSFRHALDARDLNPAHECGFRMRDNRLMVLSLGGVGVVVEGSGVRTRVALAKVSRSR